MYSFLVRCVRSFLTQPVEFDEKTNVTSTGWASKVTVNELCGVGEKITHGLPRPAAA